jgi:hypothetical protein
MLDDAGLVVPSRIGFPAGPHANADHPPGTHHNYPIDRKVRRTCIEKVAARVAFSAPRAANYSAAQHKTWCDHQDVIAVNTSHVALPFVADLGSGAHDFARRRH